MIEPNDDKTSSLPLSDTGAALPASPSSTAASPTLSPVAASTIQPPDEAKLREFDLVRIRGPVYAWDKKEAEKRTANAERVAKHREKLAAEGLRQTAVPVSLLDEVKAAGGWSEWQERMKAAAAAAATVAAMAKATATTTAAPAAVGVPATAAVSPPQAPKVLEKRVEVRVEVPVKLGQRDTESLALGRRIQALTGWKATVLKWLL